MPKPQNILNKFAKKRKNNGGSLSTTTTTSRSNKITKTKPLLLKKHQKSVTQSSHRCHDISFLMLTERYVASSVLFAVGDVISSTSMGNAEFKNFSAKNQKVTEKTEIFWRAMQSVVQMYDCSSSEMKNFLHAHATLDDKIKCAKVRQLISEFFFPHWEEKSSSFGTQVGIAFALFVHSTRTQILCYDLLVGMCIELVLHFWSSNEQTRATEEKQVLLLRKSMQQLLFCGSFSLFAISKTPLEQWTSIMVNDIIPRFKNYLSTALLSDNSEHRSHLLTLLSTDCETHFRNQCVAVDSTAQENSSEIFLSLHILSSCEASWEKLCQQLFQLDKQAPTTVDASLVCIMATSWWGALNGFKRVPESSFRHVPCEKELTDLPSKLLSIYASSNSSK